MRNYRKIPVCLLFVITLLYAAAASAGRGNVMLENKVPGLVESKARCLMHDLKKQGFKERDQIALDRFEDALDRSGFDVNRGAAGSLNLSAAWCAETPGVAHAMYTNMAPYLHFSIPKSADEPQVLNDGFKLRSDEAVVLIGPTPPPVKYFAYHAFLFTRIFPDGSRQQLFATLGDTVNNATIKTIGSTPFDRPVVIIFTPDRKTDRRVRAALSSSGYPAAIINTIVFPSSMLHLGLEEADDELRIVMRMGMPEDPDAVDAYIQNASDTLTVLRLTPRMPARPDPFPLPPLRVRGTGRSEMGLTNELGQLRQAIIDSHPGYIATDLQSMPNWYEGFDYIQRWINPWADSRDAFFLTAGNVPPFGPSDEVRLADDEFLMVYGANHAATGKATYMSVNVYASEDAKMSIGQVFHDDLAGTAIPFLPSGDSAAELMYAYKISRDCGGEPNCLQVGIEECPRLTIDSSTVLGLIFRMYLEPETKVGAAMPEILYDRVIKFSPQP